MKTSAVSPAVRPAALAHGRPSVPPSWRRSDTPVHVSSIDWQGICQRIVDRLEPGSDLTIEFDTADAMSCTVDTGDGGSRTIMLPRVAERGTA